MTETAAQTAADRCRPAAAIDDDAELSHDLFYESDTSDVSDSEHDLVHPPTVDGLAIRVLAKEGKALTLIADHIFSPALVLSECIHRGQLSVRGKSLVELGCGTGLVGLVAARHGAKRVVLTDYDDEDILACPRQNLDNNRHLLPSDCECSVMGHIWGQDTSAVGGRFDVVILADILWYSDAHKDILKSTDELLAQDGSAWVSSGKYTTQADDFFAFARSYGWAAEELALDAGWHGPPTTRIRNLDGRKANCRLWRMWRLPAGEAA